jgi:hypothetical protein
MSRQLSQSKVDAAVAEVNAAVAELDRVREAWLQRPGVTAVDVGFRTKDGRITKELAIRVHVRRKRPPDQLSDEERFPQRLGRFSVDVIEADYGPQTAE